MNVEQKLLDTLLDDNGVQRMNALMKLRDIFPREALTVLIDLLDSPEPKVRQRAAAAVSFFKPESGLTAQQMESFAAKLQHHTDEWIRLSCAINLMSATSPVVERAFLHALRDSSDRVAQVACLELGIRGGEEGRKALLQTLDHPSWRVRLEACKALITQRTADQRVVETLEKMKSEPEAVMYDAECDELDALVKQECCEQHPWWHGRWGKLDTIIAQAREIAMGRRLNSRPTENLNLNG